MLHRYERAGLPNAFFRGHASAIESPRRQDIRSNYASSLHEKHVKRGFRHTVAQPVRGGVTRESLS